MKKRQGFYVYLLYGMICCILFTLCLANLTHHYSKINSILSTGQKKEYGPLLLASGMAQSTQAQIKVIIWFDNGEIPDKINFVLPIQQWVWQEEIFRGPEYGRQTKTWVAVKEIDRVEEELIRAWYPEFANQVRGAGGWVYLDERVPESIDIAAYLSVTEAKPKQWFLSGKLQSIAAWSKEYGNEVLAGNDCINVQLLTRYAEDGGQTVLAAPAFLEEI